MTVEELSLWVVALCGWGTVSRRFEDMYLFHLQGLKKTYSRLRALKMKAEPHFEAITNPDGATSQEYRLYNTETDLQQNHSAL